MNLRFLRAAWLLPAVLVLWTIPASAQSAQSAQSTQVYEAPRTAWGHPDLQGTWINDTSTSFERPEALGDREFLHR